MPAILQLVVVRSFFKIFPYLLRMITVDWVTFLPRKATLEGLHPRLAIGAYNRFHPRLRLRKHWTAITYLEKGNCMFLYILNLLSGLYESHDYTSAIFRTYLVETGFYYLIGTWSSNKRTLLTHKRIKPLVRKIYFLFCSSRVTVSKHLQIHQHLTKLLGTENCAIMKRVVGNWNEQ